MQLRAAQPVSQHMAAACIMPSAEGHAPKAWLGAPGHGRQQPARKAMDMPPPPLQGSGKMNPEALLAHLHHSAPQPRNLPRPLCQRRPPTARQLLLHPLRQRAVGPLSYRRQAQAR